MIETIVLDYLSNALSVPVDMEIPAEMPESFCYVEKTGSTCENRICTAMIAVQSYAKTLYEAACLNEQVKAAMEEMAELAEICHVSLNSDYKFTDTQRKRHRYQAVFNITHY